MKTTVISTALFLMLFSITTFASAPRSVFTPHESLGRSLSVSVADERACIDQLTFDLHDVFKKTRLEEVNTLIDISGMIKPEQEVDDIPENLKDIIR